MSVVFDPGTEKWIPFARLKSKELEVRRQDLRLPRLTRSFVVDIVGTMIWIVRTEFEELIRITTVGGVPWIWGKFVPEELNFPTAGVGMDPDDIPPITYPKVIFTAPTGAIGVREQSTNVHTITGDQIEWSKDRSTIVDLNSTTGIATITRKKVSVQVSNVVSMSTRHWSISQPATPRVLSTYYQLQHCGMTKDGTKILLVSSDGTNAFFWLVWDKDHFNVTNIALPESLPTLNPLPTQNYLNPFTGDGYFYIASTCNIIGAGTDAQLAVSDFWKFDILQGTWSLFSALPSSWSCPFQPSIGAIAYFSETIVFEPGDKSAHILSLTGKVVSESGTLPARTVTYGLPSILRDRVAYITDANAGGLGAMELGAGFGAAGGFNPPDGNFAILAVGDAGRILFGYGNLNLAPGNAIASLWKWGPNLTDIQTFASGDFKDPDHISVTGRYLIRYDTNASTKNPVEMWQDGIKVWTPTNKDDFTAAHILRISAKTEGVFECFDAAHGIGGIPLNLVMAQITKNKDGTWTLKRGQGVSTQFTALGGTDLTFNTLTRDLWVEDFAGGGIARPPASPGSGGGGGGGGG